MKQNGRGYVKAYVYTKKKYDERSSRPTLLEMKLGDCLWDRSIDDYEKIVRF